MTEFYAPGKLMITGEYAVLQGAKALSVPTVFGQSMKVRSEKSNQSGVHWKAYDHQGYCWLNSLSDPWNITENLSYKTPEEQTLNRALSYCRKINPSLFEGHSIIVETELEFPRNWGLGSSSTFIANLSKWTKVSALDILWDQFEGSGYDVATCFEGSPIVYELLEESVGQGQLKKVGNWDKVSWKPNFRENLWFIHLGEKMDSNRAITDWKSRAKLSSCIGEDFNAITENIITENNLKEFEFLIRTHEKMLSEILGITRIKEKLFADYSGEVKSLGAWGGDFILATGSKSDMNYFVDRGFETILGFNEIIKTT